MMEYYIDPMWFYWLNVVNALNIVIGLFSFAIGVGAVSIQIWYTVTKISDREWNDCTEDRRKAKPYLILLWIMFAVCIIAVVLIPDKNTLIEMMIAKQVTQQNAGAGVEAIKSVVDYVIQSIQNAQ